MSTTVKLKRGSGSDPSASDMVVGEPVIRTDTAELFFKKDDGSVAKVSGGGGGPDFKYLALRNAANDGSASYPGNDFTLVTSGTTTAVSPAAANTLLVSYGGVIQKPNSGTSTSGITGFIVDGSRFKTATNLAAAPDFILYQESGGIGEPSDGTVTEAKLSVSNNPTNGYFLSAQSGNTGGLTWAAVPAGVGGSTGVDFNDSVKARFGTSNDLEIYHSGSDSFIHEQTKTLILKTTAANQGTFLQSNDTVWITTPAAGETMAKFIKDGAVELFYNNSKKIETSSTGGIFRGTMWTAVDNTKIAFGTGDDLQIYHDASNTYITNSTGQFAVQGDDLKLRSTTDLENYIVCTYNGAVDLYHNGVKRLETASYGLAIHEDTNKVIRFTSGIGEIGNVTGFQATNTANDALTSFGMRATDLRFATGSSERLRLDSNGDLGLGTTAVPQDSGARTLHIHDSTATERAHIRLTTGTSGTAADNGGFIGIDNNPDFYIYNQENGNLRFGTNGSERLRITNSGIIGVNIQSPIVGYGGDTGIHIHSSATSGTRGPTIHLTSGVSGTSASDGSKIHQSDTDLVIQNHENGGLFLGSGNAHRLTITSGGRCGIGTTSPSAQIHSYTSGSDGLLIQTSSYTSYVWQIESSGNLFNGSLAGELGIRGHSGIGFSANGGSSAQFRIESDGDLLGADTSIGSISDSRVKKNVVDYTYDLAKFKQLTPKTFDWINPEEHLKDTNVRGFLAQDVKTIDDYWIKETDSVNQLDKELIGEGKALSSKLGSTDAMYVSVIKQLIAKIETLETKVAALESA